MSKHLFIVLLSVLLFTTHVHGQVISTIAGNGVLGSTGDGGPATMAELNGSRGIAVDTFDNIYIGSGSTIRRVDGAGFINAFAGNGVVGFSGDNGPATLARLGSITTVAIDKKNNIYFYDGNRIRKVNGAGIITTVAGNGSALASGDGGPATTAGIGAGAGLCLDDTGNIYIYAHSYIRKVDTFGIIHHYGGTGTSGYSTDGSRVDTARLVASGRMTFDSHGNLFLVDGNRVCKINPAGIITTFACISDTAGFSGDGGPATAAKFNTIFGIYIDKCDNVFLSDRGNERIRVVNAAGIVTTIAGTGAVGNSGDGGPASAATFTEPEALCMDRNGNLYFPDNLAFVVRKITSAPQAGSIAGTDSVCPGKSVTLSGSIGGGTWVSSNTAIASAAAATGVITGISGGVDTVLYIVSMGCNADTARFPVRVKTAAACNNETTSAHGTAPGITIFPNPAHGSFTLTISSPTQEETSIVVTDMPGRCIQQLVVPTNHPTDLHLHAPPGIYLINAGGAVAKVVVY